MRWTKRTWAAVVAMGAVAARTDGNKTCVVGAVERKGRVVVLIADDATKKTLHCIGKEYVLPSSTVYTDEWGGYAGLDK